MVESILDISKDIKSSWPKSVPESGWYLTVLCSLVALNKIQDFKTIVRDLLSTSPNPAAQALVSAKIKDMLMKEWTLVGIPLVITSVSALSSVESELGIPTISLEEQKSASHYEPLDISAPVETRGYAAMQRLYRHNLDPIMSTWGAHEADFQWLEKRVIYGLFLSDHSILDALETQVVLLSGIMCQGLNAPTMWHVRGLRRLDVGVEDAETVCSAVRRVAAWAGRETGDWVRAADVEV